MVSRVEILARVCLNSLSIYSNTTFVRRNRAYQSFILAWGFCDKRLTNNNLNYSFGVISNNSYILSGLSNFRLGKTQQKLLLVSFLCG